MNGKKLLKLLLIQIGVVAALVVGYLAWDADAMYELLSGDIVFGTPMQPECDLHREACSAVLGDGTPVELSVSPRPIPVMETLTFELKAPGLEYDELALEIYGLNMNMGRYRYTLKRAEDGLYRGEGLIPSCVGLMEWRANLIAETPTKRLGTYFTFNTE